jgi:ABC-type nitrate/sulfonate/bicarbonate transport system permease component
MPESRQLPDWWQQDYLLPKPDQQMKPLWKALHHVVEPVSQSMEAFLWGIKLAMESVSE